MKINLIQRQTHDISRAALDSTQLNSAQPTSTQLISVQNWMGWNQMNRAKNEALPTEATDQHELLSIPTRRYV